MVLCTAGFCLKSAQKGTNICSKVTYIFEQVRDFNRNPFLVLILRNMICRMFREVPKFHENMDNLKNFAKSVVAHPLAKF